ncbi:ABC transporter permease [Sporolactobacillus terrae]|uniref:ABC transporter permease n=1 Tax=Sporolactobacillus terrae TaxID=269673 RepID=UPI001260B752|nr:ABC transporter permease [Sporolactobacillus terrae]
MLVAQLLTELKRAITFRNLFVWITIIALLPLVTFGIKMHGYVFLKPLDVFYAMLDGFIPLLFPILVIVIYLISFSQEQKNHFILFTRPRIPLNIYILSKGLINGFLTGAVIFFMVFLSFLFALYIEPHLKLIDYSTMSTMYRGEGRVVTFSQVLSLGSFTYGVCYSLWVSINAIVYATLAFLLMLLIKSTFLALSAPFLFYHVFNFVTGVFGVPQFSPISTLFPFNIEQQPLWTVLLPFIFLLFVLCVLFFTAIRHQEDWMI